MFTAYELAGVFTNLAAGMMGERQFGVGAVSGGGCRKCGRGMGNEFVVSAVSIP
jgi:hypothetical protein